MHLRVYAINNSSIHVINIFIASFVQGNYKADRAVPTPLWLIGTWNIGFTSFSNLHEVAISATNSRTDLISRAQANEQKYIHTDGAKMHVVGRSDKLIRSSARKLMTVRHQKKGPSGSRSFSRFSSVYVSSIKIIKSPFITMLFMMFLLVNKYHLDLVNINLHEINIFILYILSYLLIIYYNIYYLLLVYVYFIIIIV